jgi:glycosyltransferase involved in cell wall biosynthesis
MGFRRDANLYMASFDIFVLPSRYEGLPLSLLEAMAQGCPVVVSNVGGMREVVRDGTEGYVVPSQDPLALASSVGVLLDDPEKRTAMGRAAAQRVEEFSIEASMRQVEEVYSSLL